MKLFHRTWAEHADNILQHGFLSGIVQVSDRPLESTEIKSGGGGDVSLCVEIEEGVVSGFEDKDTHYKNLHVRVFKIPAEVVNAHAVRFSESNYVGMTKQELLNGITNAKRAPRRLPLAPYDQDVVLEKALAFLDKVQGDDVQRRHSIIAEVAYRDWASDPNQVYWGDDQRYWYVAEKKVDQYIRENGGVPYR